MARPEGEHFTQRNHFPERQTDTRVAGLLSPERGARRGMERQRGCRAHIKAGREDVAPSAVGDISGTPPSQHLLPCPRASARAGRPARSILFYSEIMPNRKTVSSSLSFMMKY